VHEAPANRALSGLVRQDGMSVMATHRHDERSADGQAAMARPYAYPHAGEWDDACEAADVQLEACDATEVYAHGANPPTAVSPTRARPCRRRTKARGLVALLWAGVIALAAVQHAVEIERRTGANEPAAGELAMQTRPSRPIRSAWRDIGAIAEPSHERAETGRPVAAMRDAEPRDADAASSRTELPQDKASGKANIVQVVQVSAETSAGSSVAAPTHTGAESVARASELPETKGEVPSERLAATETQAAERAQARLSPTAVRAERPIEPRTQGKQRERNTGWKSSRVEVRNVIVTPGEFVVARYFSTYGLGGRTP
jgi:hypothetical protein